MSSLALSLALAPAVLAGYAYGVYPMMLKIAVAGRKRHPMPRDPVEWPTVTLTLPVHNEAARIETRIKELLRLDYPADRLHILVISDASTDGTDALVRQFGGRVELLRLLTRGGKTAAENAAASAIRGELVVNIDATVSVPPHALKALVRAFEDPTIGVASGRDVSVTSAVAEHNSGERSYVGYEMWLRGMETDLHSIVGASGCFYGTRACIYDASFPEALSRDFASALMAKARGYRAVSVDDALCFVPRTTALRSELQRKVRTMARGIQTLWYMRALMNPRRHGAFSFMLLSHKLCRWLVYLAIPFMPIGLAMLSTESSVARGILAAGALGTILGAAGLCWPQARRVPRFLAMPAFALTTTVAGLMAWAKVLRGVHSPTWEPTRRPV